MTADIEINNNHSISLQNMESLQKRIMKFLLKYIDTTVSASP